MTHGGTKTKRAGWARAAVLILGVGLAAAWAAGCPKPQEPVQKGEGAAKLKIAAILMQQDQFFKMNEQGMKEKAAELGVDLAADNADGKLNKEVNLIDTYVEQKVGAILVSPLSAAGSVTALKRARDGGIQIITYNNSLNADFPASSISSSQTDLGASTGKAVAEYIRNHLGGKAKVATIGFVSQLPEQGGQRLSGFKSALADMPGVEIVVEQDAWEAVKATSVVENILTAHPDITIIWAANEGGTVGAVTAVKTAGLAGKVAVFGTDMSEQLADFLLADDNVLQAVTAQKPYDMGALAVETAVKVLRGEPVEKKIALTGVLYSRKENEAVKAYKAQIQKLAK